MLSVKIYTIAGGRTEAFSCGPHFNCPDSRDDFYQQNIQDHRMEAIFFSPEGCRYTIYKINGGRGDASEANLFIPKHVESTSAPVIQIIGYLRRLIDMGVTSEQDKQRLQELCSAPCAHMRNIVPMEGKTYAVLYIGGETGLALSDITNDLFRPELGGHKAIFIADQADQALYEMIGPIPASSIFPRKIVTVHPPKPNAKKFQPFIDGEPFDKEQRMFESTPFRIEWKRNKWHTILHTAYAYSSLTDSQIQPPASKYRRSNNNPLNIAIYAISASMILFIVGIFVYRAWFVYHPDPQQVPYAHEKTLFTQLKDNNFSAVNMTELGNIHPDWVEPLNRIVELSDFYGYSVPIHEDPVNGNDTIFFEDFVRFVNLVQAADYLYHHEVWVEDEMEQIEGLKGLYEFVNNYGFALNPGLGSDWRNLYEGHGINYFDRMAKVKQTKALRKPYTRGGSINTRDYLNLF